MQEGRLWGCRSDQCCGFSALALQYPDSVVSNVLVVQQFLWAKQIEGPLFHEILFFLTYCFMKSLWTLCLRFSAIYLPPLFLCQRKLVCFGLEKMMTLKWLLCTESCWDELPDGSLQHRRELFVCRRLFLWLAANSLLFLAFDLQPNSSASLAV